VNQFQIIQSVDRRRGIALYPPAIKAADQPLQLVVLLARVDEVQLNRVAARRSLAQVFRRIC
jgi:hypothetical protein